MINYSTFLCPIIRTYLITIYLNVKDSIFLILNIVILYNFIIIALFSLYKNHILINNFLHTSEQKKKSRNCPFTSVSRFSFLHIHRIIFYIIIFHSQAYQFATILSNISTIFSFSPLPFVLKRNNGISYNSKI